MNSLPSGRFVCICWICGKNVDLNTCKIDEFGEAVHEECYAARIALENGTRKPPVSFTIAVRFKGEAIKRHHP